MSAGLPGVGLSGVFFILSALLMVPLEISRTVRGQSSLTRWMSVLRHLAIALAMIVCVELAYAVMRVAVDQVGLLPSHGRGRAAHAGFHMLPVAPVLATLSVTALLLLAAKAAQLLSRRRAARALLPDRPALPEFISEPLTLAATDTCSSSSGYAAPAATAR